ncbi:Transposon TX1 uncharacterized 149 kDa protein [Vitis vinifera]|uniref:Transposon TX1 uncharacterized 149 kDa protein n=1 Tax=Vitis vinifera TaxID=29760 RepID=A0A438JKK7_VITVI|nr:Transposon TX1 uncharacterized 149 kDa protein [Vitis vinifera]
MKIISWNVRGLGSRNKRRMVKDFLRSENPDVVMIQETKKENCDRRFVGSVWTVRNKDWVALPASGASANFDAIEQEGGLNSDLLSQRASRKGELEELMLREEIHWRQKAKVKWVKEGDCNSKFYHKVANGRRNRKYIKELENERGLVLKNAERLDWSPISEESALRLDSPFTEEEISKANFQLDRDKAPGLDGFTIAVFQECWDVIKEELVRVFAEFHRSGIINQSTNASFIILLPKKSLSKRISDFRPISLITSLYKIIAKVLSGRLRGVLHETIHYTQGAFVQGRQILDAVLIANEIVDERRRKEGFSPRWRKWMSGCLSSVSYAILVNGSAKGWVKASRGLRQGDPLSHFLFTLVANVLSRMLMRTEERNMMEGFRVGRNRTRVSHLQFVDDTIFFSNSREEELQTLKSLLLVFGHISRLKASGWPILYLGLLWAGTLNVWLLDPVIERISNSRFSGCKNREVAKGFFMVRGWGRQKGSFSKVGCCVQTEDNRGFGFWEYFLEESRSSREMVMESDGHIAVLGRLLHKSFRGFPCLLVLGPSRPFSWNLNFRRNLSDFEIEDLEGLMQSLDDLYFSPSVLDARNSQVPFKVKSFVWLVAHKKVNTNDMLQVRRPYKALSPDICILCMKHGESADHLFLHCSLTIGLWHRLFQLAKMDWVPPRSIYDMMYIKFKGFDNSKRGIVLWQAASIALIRVVWWERNARIFENKARNSEFLWDSIVFLCFPLGFLFQGI